MQRPSFGRHETSTTLGETVRAFVPPPLHPVPELHFSSEQRRTLDSALLTLGRLDGAATSMPDANLLLYTFIRKEAVLSSQIEGTQSSLDDLLQHEAEDAGVPDEDVREVSRYVQAMDHGLKRLSDGFPLSNRLILETHALLLAQGRGAQKQPGEFRRSQNWIGGNRPGNAAFVPPPPHLIAECLTDLERFLHEQANPVVKAALAHAQFETIHPFLDGNGRIGRLLITLILCNDGVIRRPLLYPSLYFKQHREAYYRELNSLRATGDYERWIDFFAGGLRYSAQVGIEAGRRVLELFRLDREALRAQGRIAPTLLMIQEAMQATPVTTIAALTQRTHLTTPTVTAALRELVNRRMVKETTGRARGRVFAYQKYLDALATEDEQPADSS
jgi:Fic family protein